MFCSKQFSATPFAGTRAQGTQVKHPFSRQRRRLISGVPALALGSLACSSGKIMRKSLAPVSLGSLGPFREVLLTQQADKSRVDAVLVYPFGERHNPYEEGLAHYLEHLAWTNVRAAGDDKGNHSNALTSREATAYWLSRQPESLQSMLPRLAASASPLQVSLEFATQEKDIVQREYELRQLDDPMASVWRESSKALYANGPYARSILGTRSTIKQFSLDSAIRLHQQTHHLAEAKLLVSGPVSSSDLEQSISSIDNWPEQKVELLSAPLPVLPAYSEPDIAREQVSGVARPEVIRRSTFTLPANAEWSELLAARNIFIELAYSTKPGGLARPLRYDNFIASKFAVGIKLLGSDALEIWMTAVADTGVDLDTLDNALSESLGKLLANPEQQSFLDIKERKLAALNGILDPLQVNHDKLFNALTLGQTYMPISELQQATSRLTYEQFRRFTQHLVSPRSSVVRLVSPV